MLPKRLVALSKAPLADDGDADDALETRRRTLRILRILRAMGVDRAARPHDHEASAGRLGHPPFMPPERTAEAVGARPIGHRAGKLRQPRHQEGVHLRGDIGTVRRHDLRQLGLRDPRQARDDGGDLLRSEHLPLRHDRRPACAWAEIPAGLREISGRDDDDVRSGQSCGESQRHLVGGARQEDGSLPGSGRECHRPAATAPRPPDRAMCRRPDARWAG